LSKNHQILITTKTKAYHLHDDECIELMCFVLKKMKQNKANLSLSYVTTKQITAYNFQYRNKKTPTNVLSFTADLPADIADKLEYKPIGDIVICPQIINMEAKKQKKITDYHHKHIIIHSLLHLLGYDHITNNDAKIMESIEIKLLSKVGIKNPYEC